MQKLVFTKVPRKYPENDNRKNTLKVLILMFIIAD